jgi:hypothetical protein
VDAHASELEGRLDGFQAGVAIAQKCCCPPAELGMVSQAPRCSRKTEECSLRVSDWLGASDMKLHLSETETQPTLIQSETARDVTRIASGLLGRFASQRSIETSSFQIRPIRIGAFKIQFEFLAHEVADFFAGKPSLPVNGLRAKDFLLRHSHLGESISEHLKIGLL